MRVRERKEDFLIYSCSASKLILNLIVQQQQTLNENESNAIHGDFTFFVLIAKRGSWQQQAIIERSFWLNTLTALFLDANNSDIELLNFYCRHRFGSCFHSFSSAGDVNGPDDDFCREWKT